MFNRSVSATHKRPRSAENLLCVTTLSMPLVSKRASNCSFLGQRPTASPKLCHPQIGAIARRSIRDFLLTRIVSLNVHHLHQLPQQHRRVHSTRQPKPQLQELLPQIDSGDSPTCSSTGWFAFNPLGRVFRSSRRTRLRSQHDPCRKTDACPWPSAGQHRCRRLRTCRNQRREYAG